MDGQGTRARALDSESFSNARFQVNTYSSGAQRDRAGVGEVPYGPASVALRPGFLGRAKILDHDTLSTVQSSLMATL